MIFEGILIVAGTISSLSYFYHWRRLYLKQEEQIRIIKNDYTTIPPSYDRAINDNTAPPYHESTTPPPPIDQPQC